MIKTLQMKTFTMFSAIIVLLCAVSVIPCPPEPEATATEKLIAQQMKLMVPGLLREIHKRWLLNQLVYDQKRGMWVDKATYGPIMVQNVPQDITDRILRFKRLDSDVFPILSREARIVPMEPPPPKTTETIRHEFDDDDEFAKKWADNEAIFDKELKMWITTTTVSPHIDNCVIFICP